MIYYTILSGQVTIMIEQTWVTNTVVFILGRRIVGIPHFRKKSPKLSDTVRDKSPTLDHVAVLFKIV